ncbi:ZN271-like protein, partial [Mya arenaria]
LHMDLQRGKRPCTCEVCGTKLSRNYDLKRHMKFQTGEKPFMCEICDAAFSQKSDLKKHTRIHTGEKPYSCGICNTAFSQKVILKNTYEYTQDISHSSVGYVTLSSLRKVPSASHGFTERKTSMYRHMKFQTGEKPFMCEICDAAFSQKGPLQTHIRMHTGEKPYNDLKKHIRILTGYKSLMCGICDAEIPQKECTQERSHCVPHVKLLSLREIIYKDIQECIQERSNTSVRCDAAFTLKNNLQTHVRKHTRVKPYKCEICRVAFSHKRNLQTHMRINTREKPYTYDLFHAIFSHKSSV